MEKQKETKLENLFCPYESAQAIKELGFDEPCFGHFLGRELILLRVKGYKDGVELLAPTFQQAFRWFREKYNLLVSPFQSLDDKTYQVRDYYFEIVKVGNLNVIVSTDNFQTYDEAELECLVKLIDIVKKQNLKG